MTDAGWCTAQSLARDEDMAGTASRIRSWLLIEQPGPWGRDALLESRFDAAAAPLLVQRSRPYGVRIVLLRRPGRARRVSAPVAFVVHSDPSGGWAVQLASADPSGLLDLDFAAVAAGTPPDGAALYLDPLYLVCANGRHDVCCARLGRPIAAALAASHPQATWECSHIGGDRFAGNLVVLPAGLYFGRVAPDEAATLVNDLADGRLNVDRLRGRSCYDKATQTAEIAVRKRLGLFGVDDLSHAQRAVEARGRVAVTFRLPDGGQVVAQLALTHLDPPRMLTCAAPEAGRPRAFTLLDLDIVR